MQPLFLIIRLVSDFCNFKRLYLSSTPQDTVRKNNRTAYKKRGKSSSGWLLTSSTGVSPQLWFSQSRPHCLRRIVPAWYRLLPLGLWLDGSIISPIACYRRIGGNPVFIAGSFSLIVDNGQSGKYISDPCSCVPRHHGATANVATAHHGNNGNVLDEWVFSCQISNPFTTRKRKTGEGVFIPSPVSTLRADLSGLIFEIF